MKKLFLYTLFLGCLSIPSKVLVSDVLSENINSWFDDFYWNERLKILDNANCLSQKMINKDIDGFVCEKKSLAQIKNDADFLRKLECDNYIELDFQLSNKYKITNQIKEDCKRIFNLYNFDPNFDPEGFTPKYVSFAIEKKLPFYKGERKSGKRNGYGILYLKDGSKYEGNFKNDRFSGSGSYFWQSGAKYIGEFKNDLRHGKGIYIWPNGNKYDGDWIASERDGFGTSTFSSGEKYIGQYFNSTRAGEGVLFDKNGNIKKQGIWKNNKLIEPKKVDLETLLSSKNKIPEKEIHHQECLKANDYEGCMKYKLSENNNYDSKEKSLEQEKCWGDDFEICIAKKGKDFLGKEKLVGWRYKNDIVNSAVAYWEYIPRKVKVRGEYGRYIEIRYLYRKLFTPKSGTSPSVIGGNNINCYDSGYGSINCTSRGPTVLPGVPSSPGGIGQMLIRSIIDCRDNTYQEITKSDFPIAYGRSRKKSKWKEITTDSIWQVTNSRDKFCERVNTLSPSDFKKYE